MGIYDRDYTHDGYDGGGHRPQMRFALPPITPVVKWLLIINVIVFVIEAVSYPSKETLNPIDKFFSVWTYSFFTSIQIWRLVTYQFLHASAKHLIFNMLGLFMIGPILERSIGSKRFLIFYLVTGTLGGLLLSMLSWVGIFENVSLVGASGGILGIISATALLHPNMQMLIWGIIPAKMKFLGIFITVMVVLGFLSGENAGGEFVHMVGLASGLVFIKGMPWMNHMQMKAQKGRWEKKMREEQQFKNEVNRILDKVHDEGIGNLTRKEKQMLKEATRREQEQGR